MKAVLIKEFGAADNLYIGEWEKPQPNEYQVLVKIKATALNRADTLQRIGVYPPPAGASPILGLEMAGVVTEVGTAVTKWKVGDKVCGLLEGGGYAQYAVIHENIALPIPTNLSFEEAAGIPEVFLTAFQAINWIGQLQKGESILIHAGASGVGTAAIQLAKEIGATVYVTASKSKHDICMELGASAAIDYQSENFKERILEITNGKGVDMIIDFIAAPYFQKNINSLNFDGRLVILALMGGIKVEELNLMNILVKRLQIFGSTLRPRSIEYKGKLSKDLSDFSWAAFENGNFRPIIDSVYDWTEVADAHRYMEANKNKGKIILKVTDI